MRQPPYLQADNTPVIPRNIIVSAPDVNGNINLVGNDFIRITGDDTALGSWNGKTLMISPNSDASITLPSGLPSGFWFQWVQDGDNSATFTAGAGAAVSNLDGKLTTSGDGAVGQVLGTSSSNTYVATGDLVA